MGAFQTFLTLQMDQLQSLWKKFNDASSTTVMAGTLGSTVALYGAYQLWKNPQLVSGSIISSVRALPGAKAMADLEASLRIEGDTPLTAIPEQGWSHEEVIKAMKALQTSEESNWKDGKVSGVVYHGGDEHVKLMNQVYSMFTLSNPLHPDVFPSIRKFEAEIIEMTRRMLGNVDGVCGAVTSGGTESILMACKAHRDYYAARGITQPEMVVPVTAHAAFNKASHYFGIKLIHAPLGPDYAVDVAKMRKLITPNTILLVASAPEYAHGIIDDVRAVAGLAREHKIGGHVDSCLGGFVLPWIKLAGFDVPDIDFRVPGVTSMSADTHKYGYAPKGTSVVLFNSNDLRRGMYFCTTEWPGGIYASPTISGSRPGALVATTWASLVTLGKNGFIESARGIAEMRDQIKAGINNIEELYLVGDSKSSVVAFGSSRFNIFAIKSLLGKKGWNLNPLQKPNAIHICITHAQVVNGGAERFMTDLQEVMETIRTNPSKYEGESSDAHLYGLAHGFPDRSLIQEIIFGYLDICLKV